MMKGCEALWASNRHRRLLVLITNKLIHNRYIVDYAAVDVMTWKRGFIDGSS